MEAFLGRGVIPDEETLWPRYSTLVRQKTDLDGLMTNPFSWRRVRTTATSLRCCSLLDDAMRISSRYTKQKGSPSSTLSIRRWND